MPGVRFDRLLASTAIVLVLAVAPLGALAEPPNNAVDGTGQATRLDR
jgi:hypothetical protein